ncbi:MAG: hypothetical protein K2K70_11675, partial [Lachnospiraceae bacterium]|nr:hypothetical protein [Lachnospiraceae bacterium]
RYTTYQVGDIDVSIHVGLSGNNIRSGRFSPVHLTLKNSGEDFEGIFRMYLNAQDANTSNRTVVDKKVQIAAGETKEYTLLFSYPSSALQTTLCDTKGKLLDGNHLGKQLVMANEMVYGGAWYGCISENAASLSYMTDTTGKTGTDELSVEAVQDWMLTDDARTLDLFDVLVINQFDTTQFSEKQIAAINEWVRMGGTLILGTGAQPEKTLKAFSGTLLQGTIGNAKKISTSFGTDLDVSELQIENMKPILSEKNTMLVGKMDYGKGCVMVSTFDLAIGGKIAERLQSMFYLNMSMDRKNQLLKEDTLAQGLDFDYYDEFSALSLGNGLEATEVNGLPNVALYAVLLLFYAVFIGPILYSILRKRGKREWLWGLIPVSAVVCSVLIYLIGTGTRVKHPYINYLSEIDLSNKEVSTMQTNMMLTSPNNDPFDMEVSEKHLIPYRMEEEYSYNNAQSSHMDYKCRFEYQDQKTTMHMENLSAFDSLPFQQNQEVETKGRVEFTDMNLSHDALAGIVTNHSDYDLEQCAIICNGDLISLGELKQGESVSLDQLDVAKAWIQNVSSREETAAQVTEYDFYLYHNNDVKGLRRTVMLNRYMDMVEDIGGYYFYGFLASDQSTAYTKQYDVDLYGESAVVQKLNSDDLGEMAVDSVGTVDRFAQDAPQEWIMGRGLSTGEYTIHYDLGAAGLPELLQLSYQKAGNVEFDLFNELRTYPGDTPETDGQPFLGNVYAVNQKRGKRELIFTAGKEAVVTDLAKYIDKNKQMELIYQIEDLDANLYPNLVGYYEVFGLPRLVLERRMGS